MLKKVIALSFLLHAIALYGEKVHVYFGTTGKVSKGIYHSIFDTKSGKLTQANLAAEIRSPGFLAMNKDKNALYAVASQKEPVVASYKIEKKWLVDPLATQPIGDGGGCHIAVHPSNKFLLTAQYGGGSVAVFPIGSDGSVQARSQLIEHEGGSKVVARRQDSPHPHWVGFSPDGAYAFVPDLGLDQIVIYKVNADQTGIEPHSKATSVAGGGPRHMRFSVDGRFIYLLNECSFCNNL